MVTHQYLLLSLENVTSEIRLSRETMTQLVTSLVMSHHIDYCNSVMVGLTPSIIYLVSSSSNASRMQQLGWFLASVNNATSLLLDNSSTGYQWNSGSSSKLLRSCTTFSTTVPLVPQWSRHFLLQWSSSSPTTVVKSQICRGQLYGKGKVLPYSIVTERWARSWSRCTGSQPAGDLKPSTQRQ